MWNRIKLHSLIFVLFSAGILQAGIVCSSLEDGWMRDAGVKFSDGVLILQTKSENTNHGISRFFSTQELAGRRVRISLEAKKEILPSLSKYKGAKAVFSWIDQGKRHYGGGLLIGEGNEDWKTYHAMLVIPCSAEKIQLTLCIEKAKGSVKIRNFKLENEDFIFPVTKMANMGYADEIPRDGKGGWTDQGAGNDARAFNWRKSAYGGVPFFLPNPKNFPGKCVMVFRGSSFPDGIRGCSFDLKNSLPQGRFLYLLHTATSGSIPGAGIAQIEIVGKNGKSQTFDISYGRDVSNWWTPKMCENAFPASQWSNGAGGTVGVFRSDFRIRQEIGEIERVDFRKTDAPSVWLVLAASISNQEYKKAEICKMEIKEGVRWKRFPGTPDTNIIRGSILDLSFFAGDQPAGAKGRVVIGKNGELEFEKEPGKPVRFESAAEMYMFLKPDFKTKESIERHAEQIRRAGYNMVRFHYLGEGLMQGSQTDCVFHPESLDKFHYYIACLKKRGIYFNIDTMCGIYGYLAGQKKTPENPRNFKRDMHFDPFARKNYFTGVKNLLTHRNPYTGLTLIEDPAFVLAVGYNEQEFGLSGPGDFSQAQAAWMLFLKKKYMTPEKLNHAWKTNYRTFEDVPPLNNAEQWTPNAKGRDISLFFSERERELYSFYRESLHKMGYKGLLAQYNMSQTFRYSMVRDDCDYVAMNGYHAHPVGESIDGSSSIASGVRIMRAFAANRIYGKPFAVTEHGHGFWNQYRYEHGLLAGAYAAFQNFSVMTPFFHPVSLQKKPTRISTFWVSRDPVVRATTFLETILFLRGDVKQAQAKVRLSLEAEDVFQSFSHNDALNQNESKLALVTGLSIETRNRENPKSNKNESFLSAFGGSPVIFHAMDTGGFTQALDGKKHTFDFDRELNRLKERGLFPKKNKTSFTKGIFESSSGELFLDCEKKFFSVNTPRTQGIAAEAGSKCVLNDFEISGMSVRGSVAAIAMDGKNLKSANKIVLVIITNALNEGDVFSGLEMTQKVCNGKGAVLVETGSFSIRIRNTAGIQHCYALDMNGKRLEEIPVNKNGDFIALNINTGGLKNGPSFYYELSSERKEGVSGK